MGAEVFKDVEIESTSEAKHSAKPDQFRHKSRTRFSLFLRFLNLLSTEALWDSLEQEVQKELENSEPMLGPDYEDLESSFMESTDEEVNDSLQERIEQIASNESDIIETQIPLTGLIC